MILQRIKLEEAQNKEEDKEPSNTSDKEVYNIEHEDKAYSTTPIGA